MSDCSTNAFKVPRKQGKNFTCPNCGGCYHIKRKKGDWMRYMPPAYCPGCGEKQERGAE